MEQSLKQIHKKLEELQNELDGIPFNQMARIKMVESRIENLMNVRSILEKELQFDDRGSCQECGELGNGKTNGFISCGLHEVIIV